MNSAKMQSGVVQPDSITFENLDIDILAGRGRDPFTVMRMTVPPDGGVPSLLICAES